MDISSKYCFYVGTARGTLQYTRCDPKEKLQFTVSDEKSEITAFEWGRDEDEILVGYKNQHVQFYSSTQNQYTKTITNLEGKGHITGLAAYNQAVIIAKREGIITIWNNAEDSDSFSTNLDENGTLDCMVLSKSSDGLIATGGECNDLKLWDLSTNKCTFKAKSLGHDELNLPIPTSIRGITFLPEDNYLTAVATKQGHVLLYDSRAQRRPVVKFQEIKASYTCLASAFRQKQVLAGTTKGYLQLLDLKTPGKCMKTFTSFTGSVTGIVCDPVEPLVVTTSLDRHLRVHNMDTKELVTKMYLKQSLCGVLMKALVKEEKGMDEEIKDKGLDEEYEELFEQMETVGEKKAKRKPVVAGDQIKKNKKKRTIEVN